MLYELGCPCPSLGCPCPMLVCPSPLPMCPSLYTTGVSLPIAAHFAWRKPRERGNSAGVWVSLWMLPISSVSSFRKQKAGLGCGRGRGELCGWGRREKCLLSAHPRTIWPPSQWRNLLILPSPGWHTPYSMVLPCRGCSSTLTACCYFISRVKMANPGGGWWGMAQCHVCAHPLLAQPSLGVLHTHTPKVFLFFFFEGEGELLMSLEPLPWEPVANESLGFPLHLEPCVSW